MNKTIENKVKKQAAAPKKIGWHWLFLIAFLFCELLGHVWIRTESRHALLRIAGTEKKLVRHQVYQKALSIEVDRLKAEDRIRRIAESKLELVRDLGSRTYYLTERSDNG